MPRVERVRLNAAEYDALRHSGILEREGRLLVVSYFNDGRDDFAVRLPRRLEVRLRRLLEDGGLAIAELMAADLGRPLLVSRRRRFCGFVLPVSWWRGWARGGGSSGGPAACAARTVSDLDVKEL